MREHQYDVQTYCLTYDQSDGDKITLGSRDKYLFVQHEIDRDAELYLFRYDGGRTTKVDQHEYILRVFEIADCGDSAKIKLQTGDILLGICSMRLQSGSGCNSVLYILRPIFQRKSKTIKNPTNQRSCSA